MSLDLSRHTHKRTTAYLNLCRDYCLSDRKVCKRTGLLVHKRAHVYKTYMTHQDKLHNHRILPGGTDLYDPLGRTRLRQLPSKLDTGCGTPDMCVQGQRT